MARLDPQPIRFDSEEAAMIKELQKSTRPKPSVSFVVKRAIRFAAPKFLNGEVPLMETIPARPSGKKHAA